eukprot:CAMPEP_0179481912 /NCGR_PEP_ID=MMETSP0799-20121207/59529_1 /TAXON_ID=46947 /ORGANISM="Geminigera cryophila, Strain CCMP2564" /LENGTH=57 /DNA_ID=CAMNT_0021294771 /DNA_START=1 /DNA_END=170 /DNA_ORIENTATION=+
MLTYLQQVGDEVDIITADDTEGPPMEFLVFSIDYTSSFRFALYPVTFHVARPPAEGV